MCKKSDIESKLRCIIEGIIDSGISVENIDIHEDLSEHGINSVTVIKFILKIEKEFSIKFDSKQFYFGSMRTLYDYITYLDEII